MGSSQQQGDVAWQRAWRDKERESELAAAVASLSSVSVANNSKCPTLTHENKISYYPLDTFATKSYKNSPIKLHHVTQSVNQHVSVHSSFN